MGNCGSSEKENKIYMLTDKIILLQKLLEASEDNNRIFGNIISQQSATLKTVVDKCKCIYYEHCALNNIPVDVTIFNKIEHKVIERTLGDEKKMKPLIIDDRENNGNPIMDNLTIDDEKKSEN